MSDLWWEVYKAAREGLIERVTCKQRYNRGDGDTRESLKEELPGRGNCTFKGPGAQQMFSSHSKETNVAGDWSGRQWEGRCHGTLLAIMWTVVFDSEKGHGGV